MARPRPFTCGLEFSLKGVGERLRRFFAFFLLLRLSVSESDESESEEDDELEELDRSRASQFLRNFLGSFVSCGCPYPPPTPCGSPIRLKDAPCSKLSPRPNAFRIRSFSNCLAAWMACEFLSLPSLISSPCSSFLRSLARKSDTFDSMSAGS